MTDKELADKVVALGVGDEKHPTQEYRLGNQYQFGYFGWTPAKRFVRDWRVAGTLIEKVPNGVQTHFDQNWYAFAISPKTGDPTNHYRGDGPSPVRAIIEACVEALEPGQNDEL